MSLVVSFKDFKKIHSLLEDFSISIDGRIKRNGKELIDFRTFNELTGLEIKTVDVLKAIAFQDFKWPPIYWKYLNCKEDKGPEFSPELLTLRVEAPVESYEFPGFYLIPYYSNYLISKNGRLIKKSESREIVASLAQTRYYTFRMTNDLNRTSNQLRHRIIAMAFIPYPDNYQDLDINHKDGKPGNDSIENLEWVTRSENITHAYRMGLRNDNIPVTVREVNTGRVFVFISCAAAGRFLDITETTVSNRCKTNGYKSYGGFQFRFLNGEEAWPEFEAIDKSFRVTFPDGSTKDCDGSEAASLVGLTRTSLFRALREGRNRGTNDNTVKRINESPTE